MSLKKILIRGRKAQAIVEYVTILLAVLGLFAAFLSGVKTHLQTYHEGMVEKIATR